MSRLATALPGDERPEPSRARGRGRCGEPSIPVADGPELAAPGERGAGESVEVVLERGTNGAVDLVGIADHRGRGVTSA